MSERLSTSEAAELAGCSRQNILHNIKLGYLKAELVQMHGRRVWLIEMADLARWRQRASNLWNKEVG